jgi:hypothetical protein
MTNTAKDITRVMREIETFLIDKNLAYGDSAIDPVRIFSKASTVEQLLVRIDDKLSRVARGSEIVGDDTILDLIGYLVLLRIAQQKDGGGKTND